MAGEGAGKSAAKIRGAGGSAGEGAAPHSFPRKAPLAAPRIFAAFFPAPSPAIFWISPFLYSVAGRPGRNPRQSQQQFWGIRAWGSCTWSAGVARLSGSDALIGAQLRSPPLKTEKLSNKHRSFEQNTKNTNCLPGFSVSGRKVAERKSPRIESCLKFVRKTTRIQKKEGLYEPLLTAMTQVLPFPKKAEDCAHAS